jgi:hypothetical protein
MGEWVRVILLRDVEFWTKTRARRIARLLTFLFYVYLGVFLLLLWLENRLLYPGWSFRHGSEPPPANVEVQDVWLTSSAGDKIHAWWSAPPGWTPSDGALIYSHGNGGDLTSRSWHIPNIRKTLGKIGVLNYDYPGYGKSGGKPSEPGCYASGEAAWEWLVTEKQVAARDIVLVGESLGGGVAIELAVRHPEARMVVLASAFASFPDMATKTFPWLPARYFVTNQYDNRLKISTLKMPVFIGHCPNDNVVPYWQGQELAAKANEPKKFVTVQGVGHNSQMAPEFWSGLKLFVEQLRQESAKKEN